MKTPSLMIILTTTACIISNPDFVERQVPGQHDQFVPGVLASTYESP